MGSFLSCEWVRQEASDVWSFGLKVLQPCERFKLVAGRFIKVQFPDVQGRQGVRCYSICAVLGPDVFEISVRKRGAGGVSDSLVDRLRPGGLLGVTEVAGQITFQQVTGAKTVLMLAAGIGITVPIGLLRDMAAQHRLGTGGPKVRLVVVAASLDHVPFLTELLTLHLSAGWFDLSIRLTRQKMVCAPPCFAAGRPTAEEVFEGRHWDSVVICGGEAFAALFQAHARRLMPDCHVLVEAFSCREQPVVASVAAAPVQVNLGGKVVMVDAGKNLLSGLEEKGVKLRSQCRAGICGRCRIRVVAGEYRCEANLALSTQEVAHGYALACCTFATSASIALEWPSSDA